MLRAESKRTVGKYYIKDSFVIFKLFCHSKAEGIEED
jgi:hypothetical protein